MREFINGITYNQLITFTAIAEAGNISKAAKQLTISAASVSYSLKSLEQQLGHALFIRNTRAIRLTEHGEQLYRKTNSSINTLSLAVESVKDLGSTPSGSLSINMANDIYRVFLKEILFDYQNQYPNVQLDITLSDTLDKKTERKIDLGFRFGEKLNENMVARSINQYFPPVKTALFASEAYVEKYGLPTSIEDLAEHFLIKFRAPTSDKLLPLLLRNDDEVLTISDINTAMSVNSVEVMVDMVIQGVGMGFAMDATIQNNFDDNTLIPVLQAHWCDIPNVYMYYSPQDRDSLKIKSLVDFIVRRQSRI